MCTYTFRSLVPHRYVKLTYQYRNSSRPGSGRIPPKALASAPVTNDTRASDRRASRGTNKMGRRPRNRRRTTIADRPKQRCARSLRLHTRQRQETTRRIPRRRRSLRRRHPRPRSRTQSPARPRQTQHATARPPASEASTSPWFPIRIRAILLRPRCKRQPASTPAPSAPSLLLVLLSSTGIFGQSK